MRQPDIVSERRLKALREEAARTGQVKGGGVVPSGAPFPRPNPPGYYGIPLLKEPVWTWQVPLYFFVGGAAGACAVIGFFAHVFESDPGLARAALWIAFGGGLLCPLLLVADLGRPSRFLCMLRVFKLRSPMSVGTWTLVLFSSGTTLAVATGALIVKGYDDVFLAILQWSGEATAMVSGFILVSYTGVLLAVTAIPVWSEKSIVTTKCCRFWPRLCGRYPGTTRVCEPYYSGAGNCGRQCRNTNRWSDRSAQAACRCAAVVRKAGWALLAAGVLAGPLSLLLRFWWASDPTGRKAAAACFLAGALTIRYAWLAAGRVSARNPQALFQIQSKFPET
jgi:formate-dependent nitrite reductase membrane component NrfD